MSQLARTFLVTLLLTISALSLPAVASADSAAPAPADAAQRQRDSLLSTLTTDSLALVASLRKGCVRGIIPKSHRGELARGNYWTPDAVDRCVTILTRHGRDGTLDGLYRAILLDLVKDDAGTNTLAAEIGSYVLDRNVSEVPLARAVALPVTTALAFDAGFTNGYRDTGKAKADIDKLPSEMALKPLAERCLDLAEAKLQGCYSAGYVYGLRASHGVLVAAAR